MKGLWDHWSDGILGAALVVLFSVWIAYWADRAPDIPRCGDPVMLTQPHHRCDPTLVTEGIPPWTREPFR
jgi:hypothetical protein